MSNEPTSPPRRLSSGFTVRIIGTILSLLLFIWLLSKQNWEAVWSYIQKIPVWTIVLALALYLSGLILNSIRWQILLRPPKIIIPLRETTKIVFAGVFASNFLPSTIGGDALRFLWLSRLHSDRITCLTSIAIDRIINLAAFFTNLPITLAVFGSPITVVKELLSAAPEPISVVVCFLGLSSQGQDKKIPELIKRLGGRMRDWLDRGKYSASIWLKHPWHLALAFVTSWLSIFVIFCAIWFVAGGLEMPITLFQVMGVTLITYLVTLLPISVNGLGIREVAITGLYTYLGCTSEQAAILAVLTRFLSMVATLPGALWISQAAGLNYTEDNSG